jgi:NAD(P)-dependent dehydrogenase (short-subunit alcohol dehydrogenase family)
MTSQRKTAIVTGASSGIGLAIASSLLAAGWNVVGNARTRQRLDDAAARLDSDRFLPVPGDITQPATAKELVETAVARFGQVDLLVNNAGIFLVKPFVDLTTDDIEQQIATNVKSVIYASQQAARHMVARKQGQIINITASVALKPRSDIPAYLAVLLKGGLNEATRALALELAPHGVRVNAVAPGIIETPMHPPESHGFLKTLQPARRLGTVEEVADAVLYMAGAAFTNGVVLPVDGGMAAGNV